MERLDSRVRYSTSMEEYLEIYGRHFNKAMFEYATSLMRDRTNKRLNVVQKEDVDRVLKDNKVEVKRNVGYDCAYVYNMALSDYYGNSIQNPALLAFFVQDYIDDVDGNPTRAFDEFYINCVAKGVPIFWEDLL